MSDNIIDMMKESKKQNIKKRKQIALRDNETFLEIIALLERDYLCDGERYYKAIDYRNRICKLIKYTVLKNACINIKPPQKVDAKTANDAINSWKSECVYISEPSLHRDDDDESWQLEAKSGISNIIIENDPRRWLDVWLSSKEIRIAANGDLYADSPKKLSKSQVIRQLNCDFTANKPEKTRINLPVLKDAFYLKIDEVVEKKRKELIDSLRFKPDIKDNLSKFCKALTGSDNEVDRAVLYHLIWQVKRKMFGLKVYDHLMPIVYGTQKIGKSEAIKKFLSPIHDLYVSAKFVSITDERKSKSFERNFVMFFDEMQGATRADIENVKEKITSDRIAYRPLFTNDEEQVENNCTFIGTSNKPLYRLIRDETGMRRFYQINAKQKCDWEAINKIDYMAIWLDVDEELETPITRAFADVIKEQQEDNREKHSVELWVEENELIAGALRNEINTLYSHYTHYCANGGLRPESKVWFSKKMIELLCIERLKSNGKVFYHLNKTLSLMFGFANDPEN
jgi:hypothetical protein